MTQQMPISGCGFHESYVTGRHLLRVVVPLTSASLGGQGLAAAASHTWTNVPGIRESDHGRTVQLYEGTNLA